MERFFEEFSAEKGKEKWMEEVLKDLKGKTYDRIWWKTYEGFDLEPYYKAADLEGIVIPDDCPGEFPYQRSAKPVEEENKWSVCQEISQRDPGDAKKAVADAVKGGAECIDLKLNCELASGKAGCGCKCGCRPEYTRGTVINTKDDLAGITASLDGAGINIEAGVASKEIFEMIEPKLGEIIGSIDNDPLKELALNGEFAKGEQKRFEEAEYIFNKCSEYKDFKGMTVSGVHFHDAGATIVQKIAYMLSTAVYYKEKFAGNKSFTDFNRNIRLSYGVGQYYLLEIAGLRALRTLWANIASAYGDKDCAPDIHAVTGLFNKTVYDPYVNMLRTTTEAMSAAVGGCGSMTVLPYNVCIGESDSFAGRIARNTQLILKNEAKFDRFVDPAKGSYFIEKATDLIAKEAWALFNKIESEGGIFESLKKGDIQKELAELKKKRLSNFSMRRDNLVGTNFVPNYSEKSVCPEIKKGIEQKLDIFGCELYRSGGVKIEKVRLYRISEEFEALRKLTEKFSEKKGKPVSAFLATLGNLTMRKARASFSMGYLAAGGFDIIDNNGFKDASEAADEALRSGAEIIVICSSDEEYPAVAPEIASKIKAADPKKVVVLAGYPKEIIDDLKKAGVDEFIHLKSDSLETIRNIQSVIGITE
ncbi:MAG: methylmalonyl-CoA mutase family protein [Candidatus Delongbacteria bacterium]|nr:methylmalonyl-CoA mutase family protein [Candidatus Delongbacteria bacterium]